MANKTYHQIRAEVIRLLILHGAMPSSEIHKAVEVNQLASYFIKKEKDPEDYLPEIVTVESYRRIHIVALRNWHKLYSERERAVQLMECRRLIDAIATRQNSLIAESARAAKARNPYYIKTDRTGPPSLLTLLEEFRNARLSS